MPSRRPDFAVVSGRNIGYARAFTQEKKRRLCYLARRRTSIMRSDVRAAIEDAGFFAGRAANIYRLPARLLSDRKMLTLPRRQTEHACRCGAPECATLAPSSCRMRAVDARHAGCDF